MEIQEARRRMFMVKVGFQSLTCSRSPEGHEGVLGSHGRTGLIKEAGVVRGLSSSWMAAFPRMMTGILLEREILRQVLRGRLQG